MRVEPTSWWIECQSTNHWWATSSAAYSPDMSPIEHVWDMVGRCLARNPRPTVTKDELWVRIQTIWNALPQTGIQNLFDSMPRRVAALIAVRGGYTKYWFRSLVIDCLLWKFNHLFVLLPLNCVLNFIYLWQFLHGVAFFTNMSLNCFIFHVF